MWRVYTSSISLTSLYILLPTVVSIKVVGVYGNAGTYSALDLLEQCDTVIGICVNDWTELATDSSGLQVRRIIQIDDRLVAGDSFRFAPSAVLSCGYLGESLGQVNKALEEYMRPLTRYSHRVTGTVDIDLDAIVTHEPKTQKHTWEELKKESYTKPVGTPSTFLQIERLIDSSEVKSKVHCHPAVFFDVMARYLSSSSTICADIGDNALFMAASLAAQRGQRFLTSEHLGIMVRVLVQCNESFLLYMHSFTMIVLVTQRDIRSTQQLLLLYQREERRRHSPWLVTEQFRCLSMN